MAVARKRFGQHFLTDEAVLQRMLDSLALRRSDHVVEIGPGQGALTRYLYQEVDKLAAVELDRDLVPRLRQEFMRATIHNADVLNVDVRDLLAPPLRIVGNLPYNISSPLMIHLLGQLEAIRDMHFMVQREVGLRLAAVPGTKAWGRLGVMMQYHCDVTCLFDVAPESFSPPPKVWSSVVRLTPREAEVPLLAIDALQTVLRTVFSQRRKRVEKALKGIPVDWPLDQLGVDPNARADHIDLNGYVRLANHLEEAER